MIPDFGQSDVLHLNLPLKQILSSSLKNNNWPLWTPYIAGGFPILTEGQIGTFYLPNLVLFRFLPTVAAYNLNLVIAFALSYLGIYLFGRGLKLSRISSTFAATVFTFSSFLSVHLNHFNLIQAASLLPLIFWSFYLLWQKPKTPYIVLCAFLLSQQIFTGHFYIVFITLVGIFIYFVCLLTLSGSWNLEGAKRFFFFLVVLILTFLLSAIQLLPTIELWQLSARAQGLDFGNITSYPYPPKHLLSFFNPYIFGNPANGTYPPFDNNWGIFWENTAYIGLLPLALSLGSIFFFKDKLVKIFLIILFISLLLVLGKYSPLYLIFSFPPFNFFRVPSKFLLLTSFSLSLLSALLFEKMISWLATAGKSHIHAIASICYKHKLARVSIIFIIFILVTADEYRFSYNYPPVTPAKLWTEIPDTAKFLSQKEGKITSIGAPLVWNNIFLRQGWVDLKPYENLNNSLYPNYNAIFNIPSIDLNTGGLIPKRYSYSLAFKEISFNEENKTASISAASQNALSLAGVRYLISPFKIISPNIKQVYETALSEKNEQISFYIYQNSEAFSRVYFASKSEKVQTVEEIYRKLQEKDFLAQNKVLVEEDDFLLNSSLDKIGNVLEIVKENDTEIILSTKTNNPQLLVLTDSNYPGWKATIDDKSVKAATVNLTQKAVLVPSGTHKIVFTFNSISFELGKVITLVSLLITSAVLFLYRVSFPRKASGSMLLLRDP